MKVKVSNIFFYSEFRWEWQHCLQWPPCSAASGKMYQGPKITYVYAIVISLKPFSSFCTTTIIMLTRVSYMTQLDVWMVTCIFIVFLCIFEFVVASTLIKAGKKVLLKSFPPFQKVSTWSYYMLIRLQMHCKKYNMYFLIKIVSDSMRATGDVQQALDPSHLHLLQPFLLASPLHCLK